MSPSTERVSPVQSRIESHSAVLVELLAACEEFLRTVTPAVHRELRDFLTARGYHPTAGLPAFLDQLQFTVHHHR